jgi:hypothetical protein
LCVDKVGYIVQRTINEVEKQNTFLILWTNCVLFVLKK